MNEKQAKRQRKARQIVERDYYVDTSSLRKAGGELVQCNAFRNLRTSMLAILELVSGVRDGDNEFVRRRSALENIDKARVSIDWREPEILWLGAFGRTLSLVDGARRVDDMGIKLREIRRRVVASNSLADFQKRLDLEGLQGVMDSIREYDDRVSKTFVLSTVKGNADTKKIAAEIRSGVRPAPPAGKDWSLKEFSEHLERDVGLNRSITVYAIASRVSKMVGTIAPGEIHDTYNSRLDAFVDAFSIASIRATGNMNAPGRNDGMDFMHFFYMNPNTVMVSEDVKQCGYARRAGQLAISFDDYRKLLNKVR